MSRAVPPTLTAWVNCSAGVAGDMLLAALVDAGADRLAVMDAWSGLGLDGFSATFESVQRAGVAATWLNLCIADNADDDHVEDHVEDHGDDHRGGHHDEHHQHHQHRPAREVIDLIANADLPERVRDDSIRVYRSLAAVEGQIHGIDPDDVELHEVGALDSILDIVGVCAALADLGIDELTYSPIGIGVGITTTAHGTIPHPAPATTRLIEAAEANVVGVATDLETATPTGVALLTVLGAAAPAAPPMTVNAVGFGAGTADPADRANVVEVLIGTRSLDGSAGDEIVHELSTNVDDATPEVIAYTIDRLMSAGALDAWATPIAMKKSRLGVTVSCLVSTGLLGPARDVLLSETGSFGARVRPVGRWTSERTASVVVVDGHEIDVKSTDGRRKAEYDHAARAARRTGRPLRDVIAEAERLSQTDV